MVGRGWGIAMVAVLLATAAAFAPLPARTPSAVATLDSEEQVFLTLINQYRQQNSLSTLSSTPTMEAAAEWMSGGHGRQRLLQPH